MAIIDRAQFGMIVDRQFAIVHAVLMATMSDFGVQPARPPFCSMLGQECTASLMHLYSLWTALQRAFSQKMNTTVCSTISCPWYGLKLNAIFLGQI